MSERATFVDYKWRDSDIPGETDCLVIIVNDKERYDQMAEDDDYNPMAWFTFQDEAEFQRAFDQNNNEHDFYLVREH